MARIITKELALEIVKKLGAEKSSKKNMPHDLFTFKYDGKVIAKFGIRRGSEKDKGHDFIPGKMHVSTNEAKLFAQCTHSLDWYIEKMKEKGFIEKDAADKE